MDYTSFVYGSYPSQSLIADCERCMNWYPESIEAPGAPVKASLYPTPGQSAFVTATEIGTRALFASNSRAHAVLGGGLYEVFASGSATRRGSVTQDTNPAQMAYNGAAGNQLLTASGQNGYLVNLTTNALTQVLTGDCTMVAMLDTYFLAFDLLTSRMRWSKLNDGTTWDPLNYAGRSSAPDPWQAMVVDGQKQIWLIGSATGEVWYDQGGSNVFSSGSNPFAPIPGAVFPYGTCAPWSVKVVGDRVLWLSQSVEGAGIVVSARGYTPQRVSNHAVEEAIATYARTAIITDAEGVTYQDRGHLFYALSFPSANATWVLDLTTNVWHERGKWNSPLGRYDVWSPRAHAYVFGRHLVGDRTTGTINTLDVAVGTESDGSAIRRLRIPPPLWKDAAVRHLFVSRFDLRVEPGLGVTNTSGLAFPNATQGSNPSVMLRTSKNAKTWSNERSAQAGAIGKVDTNVFWTRLGSSTKLWVPEVTVSDPIPWRIVGADVAGRGFAGGQRAAA